MKHEREFRRLPETEVAIGVVLQAAANEQACRGVQVRAGACRGGAAGQAVALVAVSHSSSEQRAGADMGGDPPSALAGMLTGCMWGRASLVAGNIKPDRSERTQWFACNVEGNVTQDFLAAWMRQTRRDAGYWTWATLHTGGEGNTGGDRGPGLGSRPCSPEQLNAHGPWTRSSCQPSGGVGASQWQWQCAHGACSRTSGYYRHTAAALLVRVEPWQRKESVMCSAKWLAVPIGVGASVAPLPGPWE